MDTLAEMYIDFLYQELGKDVVEQILMIPPGLKILRNGFTNLFDHPHVVLWHRFLLENFDPSISGKPYAIFLPCTSIKPYRLSPTHRIADSLINKYGLESCVQIYVLSEPMILVPRELDIYYPFANYEYPPKELGLIYRERFIEILSKVIAKLKYHKKIVAVLPKHHLGILLESAKRANDKLYIEVWDYGKKAFQSIKQAIEKAFINTSC